MKKKQAFRLAIKALEREMQTYAFDANLYLRNREYMTDDKDSHVGKSYRQYVKLSEAKKYLEDTIDDPEFGRLGRQKSWF